MKNVHASLPAHRDLRSLAVFRSVPAATGATALGLVLATLSGAAQAQEAATGEPPAVYALDPVSASAERTEKRPVDALAPVSVREAETFNRWMPADARGMLEGIPGVTGSLTAGQPGMKINIRGMEDFGRVAVMVDGARQNFQRSGHAQNTSVFIDPSLIGKVDVIRGPGATVYGSGALGGVVSFETKDAADLLRPGQTLGGQASTTYGSNGDAVTGALTGAGRADWADILVSGAWSDRGDYEGGDGRKVTDSGWTTKSGLAKLTLTPNDEHQVRVTALRSDFDYAVGNVTAATRDDFTVTTDTYAGRWRFTPGATELVDLTTNLSFTSTEQEEERVAGAPLNRLTTVGIDTLGGDVFNTARFATGPATHAVTIGVDGFKDTVDTAQAGGVLPFTPDGDRSLVGAFIQDEVRLLERFHVTGALRFDSYSLEGGGTSSEETALSPKLTLGMDVVPGTTVYGTWAEAFRAPSVTETLIGGTHPPPANFRFQPNPNLKPETATSVELGVNHESRNVVLPDDRLTMKVSVYRSEVDDYIGEYFNMAFMTIAPGVVVPDFANSVYGYDNLSQVTLNGAEVEVGYDVGYAFANMALTRARGKNSVTGERLQSGLGDRGSLTIGGRDRPNGLEFGWRMSGRLGLDKAHYEDPTDPSDDPAGGYLLHGAFLTYTPPQWNEVVTLSLMADNIFDHAYQERVVSDDREPGRSFGAGLTVRF